MIMLQEIPEGSVEIQTGLYLYEYQTTIAGNTYTFRKLYSADGYCFYDAEAEVYDNEGNLVEPEDVLPEQRVYMQYAVLGIGMSSLSIAQLNARYISVPVDDSYEIVSISKDETTI